MPARPGCAGAYAVVIHAHVIRLHCMIALLYSQDQ